jgi:glycosyltransferase involved in cell wall biosynthesis
MKTIVISAVNLKVGGTLTILRDCLQYLSGLAKSGEYRVVAVVYSKRLAYYPQIEYIEMEWPKKNWINRLWCEYVYFKKVSKQLAPVYLWFSLHDTSPNVIAERCAVYCHNPFPFYRWKIRECIFTPKIVLFALFSKYIYRVNIHNNKYVIVQQQWIKDQFLKIFGLRSETIVVAPPSSAEVVVPKNVNGEGGGKYSFIYPSSANSHKNFECLCQAVTILEKDYKIDNFNVYITVKGDENRYAKWLHQHWGQIRSLHFLGFLDKNSLLDCYSRCNCLIFPSKVETWGLPISEFAAYNKPMLLADLPYAHETGGGCAQVAFFDPESPEELAAQMEELINGDNSMLHHVPIPEVATPIARSWRELFQVLLQEDNIS